MAEVSSGVLEGTKRKGALKPAQCGKHIRERLAESFEEIVTGFVDKAKAGNCQHVKLICELLETEPAMDPQRKKGSAEAMLAEMKRRIAKRQQQAGGQEPMANGQTRVRGGGGRFVKGQEVASRK